MGHRYYRQVNSSLGELHLHHCGSGVLHKVGEGEACHECQLVIEC
jgi:hypothetical protein